MKRLQIKEAAEAASRFPLKLHRNRGRPNHTVLIMYFLPFSLQHTPYGPPSLVCFESLLPKVLAFSGPNTCPKMLGFPHPGCHLIVDGVVCRHSRASVVVDCKATSLEVCGASSNPVLAFYVWGDFLSR